MKRKFLQFPITAAQVSRIEALRRIARMLQADENYADCKIEVNNAHKCVDVYLPDGMMYQIYPNRAEPKSTNRYYYEYVGEGKGDYIRKSKTGTRNYYEDNIDMRKHVDEVETYNN